MPLQNLARSLSYLNAHACSGEREPLQNNSRNCFLRCKMADYEDG